MTILSIIFNVSSGVLALVAALLWWRASKAEVLVPKEGEPGYNDMHIINTGTGRAVDVLASATLQTKRNSTAAAFAGFAALFQVAGTFAGLIR